MEHSLTKKQAEAIITACRHWKDDISLITDEKSFVSYSDWRWQLKRISYAYTLSVNINELYSAINELCVVLANKLESGEFE